MKERFLNYFLLFVVFLLPLQTQLIFGTQTISNEISQYGIFSIFVVEAMVAFIFVLRGRRQTDKNTLTTWRALYWFLAIGFFSLSFGNYGAVGWFHMTHFVSAAILFFLITDERTNVKQVFTAFLLGLLLPIAIGWCQVLTGWSFSSTILGIAGKNVADAGVAVVETLNSRMLRAYGTFQHPNIFGGYLAVGIMFLVWIARYAKRRREIVFALFTAAILGASLISTFSRSAWLAVVSGGLALLFLLVWNKRAPPKRAILIAIVGLFSILTTSLLFHDQIFSRFTPSMRVEAISIEERVLQYQTFGDVFLSSPLLGVSPGGYVFKLSEFNPGFPAWAYQPIHNTLLLILAELGIFGFGFFIYWIYSMDKISHALTRKSEGMFALSLGVVILVLALFDHYLWSLWPGLVLSAVVFGSIVKLSKQI